VSWLAASLSRSLEQRFADIILQVLDLLADRAGGHAQLIGRAAEVHVPGRHLEGPQRIERRQSSSHIDFLTA
jgi:hypothetical protein